MTMLADAIVAASGWPGTKAMEQVASGLAALESDVDQQREEKARPGPPSCSPPARSLNASWASNSMRTSR